MPGDHHEKLSVYVILVYNLALILLVANLVNEKWCKKPEQMTKSLSQGYSSESTQQELSNEYQIDTV